MTDDFSKDNLGSRAEEYLNCIVCKNLEMCVEVLQQCESLIPLADELKIVSRCIDAIASKTCAEQIASSFSRLEYSSSGRLHMSRQAKCDGDWWIEDISVLRIDMYQRVITAMKCRGVRPESIGASLVNYAEKELTKKTTVWNQSSQNKTDSNSTLHEKLVVETIVGLLPVEKLAVPIHFLFGLLRSAVMLDCAISSRLDLERRIGSQLDQSTLDDILIPSFKHSGDTLFDVDTVHRLLVNFSQQDDSDDDLEDGSLFESDSPRSPSQTSLVKVSKLVDNYLAEIAPDANLKLSKFLVIAETLPAHARTVHDGLYRAIDIYLKVRFFTRLCYFKCLRKFRDFKLILSVNAFSGTSRFIRLGEEETMQINRFSKAYSRSWSARCAKRAPSSTINSASSIFRTTKAKKLVVHDQRGR